MGIGFEDCRGQTFDNASNLAGIYSGVQARVLKINDKAVFIPCMAHSLNLSCTAGAESCTEAVTFSGVVQKIYVFLSSSSYRWKLLCDELDTHKRSSVPNDSVIHDGQLELMPLIAWQKISRLTRKYCRHSKMIHYRRKTRNMKQNILEKQWTS